MTRKHIVIDARKINSSTGHYAERLLDYLQHIDTVNNYSVLVYEKEKDFWKPSASNFSIVVADYPHYSISEQINLAVLLYRLKPDLVHFTMPQQPLLWFGKRVTTVHDLILVRYDNIDMNPIVYRVRKALFTFLLRNVSRRSEHIITPTEYVKNDLTDWLGGASNITATLEAGDIPHVQPEPVAVLRGLRYVCFIGNAFPYKNLPFIVDAFAQLKKSYPDLHLVFVGKKDYFYEQLEQYCTERAIPDVHILGYVSEGEKRWILQHAECHITASLSEGFHIPLLEAMYEDCPVLSSTATCLPEVAGDAALYFDPHDVTSLVSAVDQLLSSPDLEKDLIKKGRERVKMFSWKRMAQQTLDIYNKVD